MKNIVKLTESDLNRIVKKVMNEAPITGQGGVRPNPANVTGQSGTSGPNAMVNVNLVIDCKRRVIQKTNIIKFIKNLGLPNKDDGVNKRGKLYIKFKYIYPTNILDSEHYKTFIKTKDNNKSWVDTEVGLRSNLEGGYNARYFTTNDALVLNAKNVDLFL